MHGSPCRRQLHMISQRRRNCKRSVSRTLGFCQALFTCCARYCLRIKPSVINKFPPPAASKNGSPGRLRSPGGEDKDVHQCPFSAICLLVAVNGTNSIPSSILELSLPLLLSTIRVNVAIGFQDDFNIRYFPDARMCQNIASQS